MPPEAAPIEIIPPDWLIAVLYVIAFFSFALWGVVFARLARGMDPITWTPHRHVPWGWAGSMLAAFCLWMSTVQTLATLVDESSDAPPGAGQLPRLEDVLLFAFAVFAMAIGAAYALRKHYGATRSDFGLPSSLAQLTKDSGLGIAVCIAMLVPVYAVQAVIVQLLGLPSGHPTIEQLMAKPSGEGMLAAVITAVIVAPLFEEFTFRVLLQGWFERLAGLSHPRGKSVWPILGSSFLFAITHQGQGAAPVALFVLALGLGYLYRQTHRFAPCVAAHAFFNAFSLLLAWGSSAATAS